MDESISDLVSLKQDIMQIVSCERCGWCCTNCDVQLSEKDFKRLIGHLRIGTKEFYTRYINKDVKNGTFLIKPCPFLIKENNENATKCKIYLFKPKTCKEFPFCETYLMAGFCPIGKNIINILQSTGIRFNQDQKSLDKSQELWNEREKKFNQLLDNKNENSYGAILTYDITGLKYILEILKELKIRNIKTIKE